MDPWRVAVLLSCLAVPAAADQTRAVAVSGPMPVTTDKLEYCEQLAARVQAAALMHPREDAADQIRDSRAQCAAGHVEIGVFRLRLLLMKLDGD